MKRKNRIPTKRFFIFLILLSSMFMLGVSYAAWTSRLQITSQVTTGNFNLLFADKLSGNYSIALVNEYNQIIEELDTDIEFLEKEKKLKLLFQSGLPVEELLVGNRIKIDFSLTAADDNSITGIKKISPDFDNPSEFVEFTVMDGALVKDEIFYSLPPETGFEKSLDFEVYRELNPESNQLHGCIFLQLTPESMELINQFPKTLTPAELERHPLESEQFANVNIQNGILIIYSCDIPFSVEQQEIALSSSEKGGR